MLDVLQLTGFYRSCFKFLNKRGNMIFASKKKKGKKIKKKKYKIIKVNKNIVSQFFGKYY